MTLDQYRKVAISQVVIGDQEIDSVIAVLRSANLRERPEGRAFEQESADVTGAKLALTASSGTAALHMSYAALLRPGDEVLIPSFTFFVTASMVVAAGVTPIFCDI